MSTAWLNDRATGVVIGRFRGPGPALARRFAVPVVCLSLLGAFTVWLSTPGAKGSVQIGGHFDLSTTDGRSVTDATYRGKWLLVYFGYTSCPDLCPTVLSEIGIALKQLGPVAAKVQPVFVTLDPTRDSARALGDYLSSFDPRIVGLRGSPDEIETTAKAFHVYYHARSLGDGDYAVDHSSFLYVMKPDGSFDEILPGDMTGKKLGDELHRLAE